MLFGLRSYVFFCLLALLFCPTSGQAGAWPREKGQGFASSAIRLATTPGSGFYSQYSTVYLEYGLTPKLTAGLDVGHSVSGGNKVMGFLRYPITIKRAKTRYAFELGLGQINGRNVVRPGLSIGRGLSFSKGRSGWLSLDSQLEIDIETQHADLKTDFTAGVNFANGRKAIFQIQAGQPYDRQAFFRLAPSVVLPIGRKKFVEVGATWGLVGDSQVGLKVGYWQEF